MSFTFGRLSGAFSRLANRSCELEGALAVRESAVQLGFLDCKQDLLKTGPREHAHSLQVIPGYQPGWANLLGRGFGQKVADEFVRVKAAMARQTIQAMQFQVFFKSRQANKPLQRRLPPLPDIFETKMIRDQPFHFLRVHIREAGLPADTLC